EKVDFGYEGSGKANMGLKVATEDDKLDDDNLTGSLSVSLPNPNYVKLLDNFNLDIKPGEKIGLVGRSGAGKSTLVNLLLRFFDVDSGRITIDNQAIHEVTQESLRR